MLDHIDIAVSDYEKSKEFYIKALAPIGYKLLMEVQGFAGFGLENGGGAIASFWIHEDKTKISSGMHIAFTALNRKQVDDFYAQAISAGGVDNGKPGIREIYHPDYYGAFVFDPDDNNIEAVCHSEQSEEKTGVISRSIEMPCSKQEAYTFFVDQFSSWWPKEYTWSKDHLTAIHLEPKINGRCYEEGANGFQCQFTRVLSTDPGNSIHIAWQIGPQSQPQPNPENASEIIVTFQDNGGTTSKLTLEHKHIDRHGAGAEQYFKELNSKYGWDWILSKYQETANRG